MLNHLYEALARERARLGILARKQPFADGDELQHTPAGVMAPAVPDLVVRVEAEVAPGGAPMDRVGPGEFVHSLTGEVSAVVLCHAPDVRESCHPRGAVSEDPLCTWCDVHEPGLKVAWGVAPSTLMDELDQPVIFVIDGARRTQNTREVTDHIQGPSPVFPQGQDGLAKPIAEVLDRATLVCGGDHERFFEQPVYMHASTAMDDEAWPRGKRMQKVEQLLIALW